MPEAGGPFPHLTIEAKITGRARSHGGPKTFSETEDNKKNRVQHSAKLSGQLSSAILDNASSRKTRHPEAPPVPAGISLVLRVQPDSDLQWLITSFGVEIVSEVDDGYVIVASSDAQLAGLKQKIAEFASGIQGSGGSAKIYDIESTSQRLQRILSESLQEKWPQIQDDQILIVDVSLECTGATEYPERPEKRLQEEEADFTKRALAYEKNHPGADMDAYRQRNPLKKAEAEETYAKRMAVWEQKVAKVEELWDELQDKRFQEIQAFVTAGGGEIVNWRDGPGGEQGVRLPDSVEVRLRISGLYLRDLFHNFHYVFEISEPPDIQNEFVLTGQTTSPKPDLNLLPPDADWPTVAIIDSGIQEGHQYLAGAVRSERSVSYVPDQAGEYADRVPGGGHGTRVAGAVLYGEDIPQAGNYQLPFWLRNIRVLDERNALSSRLRPTKYLEAAVASRQSERIFNHSINTSTCCRPGNISAWASAIDLLSFREDILVIQSGGNLKATSSRPNHPGILEHLSAGRAYPGYLLEPSARVASPGESLMALTVGSIAYPSSSEHCFGDAHHPSSFSRTGLGSWDTLKPDVVEFGGDWTPDGNDPPRLTYRPEACPALIRSTLHGVGPAHDRDAIGTSFAAPKVARLAASLQKLLPGESCQLYRALIALSARWPGWVKTPTLETLRTIGYGIPDSDLAVRNNQHRITLITTGTPQLVGGDAHIYQVQIPYNMRRPEMNQRIRVDVSLAYAAKPRRTRRTLKRYLSTWLSWEVSQKGEGLASFQSRILENTKAHERDGDGIFAWHLRTQDDHGQLKGTNRNQSTLQKDWCVLQAHQLPSTFCVAVVGHAGWAQNMENAAKYALAISFEAIDGDLEIYALIKSEVKPTMLETPIQLQLPL